MFHRSATIALTVVMLASTPRAGWAENAMGYQLLTAQQASALPRNGGSLGMQIGSSQQVDSGGMMFEVLKVVSVRRDAPAERAGLAAGDQIVAVDGHVFPSMAAFAAYVGSVPPGQQIHVDYMPGNQGPQQAQRVAVTVGGAGQPTAAAPSQGMSTGAKVAIGVGAAALFGCYELGCFAHRRPAQPAPQ